MGIFKQDTNLWWRIWLISSTIYLLWWDTYFPQTRNNVVSNSCHHRSIFCALRHKLLHIQAIVQCAYPWKQAQYGGFLITPEQIIRTLELLKVDKAPSLDELYPWFLGEARWICSIANWGRKLCPEHKNVGGSTSLLSSLIFKKESREDLREKWRDHIICIELYWTH